MKHNIGQHLSKRAAICGNSEAFVEFERQRRFTFSELNQRCNRIANTLIAKGVKPGDRVATLLKNGIEFVESYYAIAKIGAVMVPLNWRLVSNELSYILSNSGAETLIFDADFDASAIPVVDGNSTSLNNYLRVNAIESPDAPTFSEDYDDASSAASDQEPQIIGGDDDLLFIMYTSGTTGLPKGVM